MYFLVYLLVAILGSTTVTAIPTPTCNNTRGAVLECASALFDLDHNGIITPIEVNVAISTFAYVPVGLTWQMVMRCDMNGDSVLTMDDWLFGPPNATCLPTQNCLNIACNICIRNGFTQARTAAAAAALPAKHVPASDTPHSKVPEVEAWKKKAAELLAQQKQKQQEEQQRLQGRSHG